MGECPGLHLVLIALFFVFVPVWVEGHLVLVAMGDRCRLKGDCSHLKRDCGRIASQILHHLDLVLMGVDERILIQGYLHPHGGSVLLEGLLMLKA